MANASLTEIRKSNNNSGRILEARVVANYGDPGLDEDYQFDILSRFVIVMLESCYRVPTTGKWGSMFAVVLRPQNLWVNLEGSDTKNPTTQKRSDFLGNISVGAAGNFSVGGVPRINQDYQLGDLIKIKKLSQPLPISDTRFLSGFGEGFDSTTSFYNNWHTQGSSFPYFQNSPQLITNLRLKTLSQPNSSGDPYRYGMSLRKEHYEAFMLTYAQSTNPSLVNGLISIFSNTFGASNSVYSANGGYLFNNANPIILSAIEYEDMNVGNKQRVATSDCLPLVVATPQTFPTPQIRQLGTISYNPTYSPIVTT